MRKLMSVLGVLSLFFVVVACEEQDDSNRNNDTLNSQEEDTPTNEEDQDPNDDPSNSIDDEDTKMEDEDTNTDENESDNEETSYDSYYEKLQAEGKTVTTNRGPYHDGTWDLDYSDDSRTVADTSTLGDDDIIDIPSQAIRNALSTRYSIDTPITYGDVRSIERITLSSKDVESLAGIEYFTSLIELQAGFNPKLTSIKGVEALDHLESLNISHTAVKTIDYAMPALATLDAVGTFVDIDATNLTDTAASMPNLRHLDLSKTSFKVTDAVLSEVSTIRETQSLNISIDYNQLDFDNVGYDAFWEFDEDGKILQYKNLGIDCNFVQSEASTFDSIESLYVDVTNPSFNDNLVETFETLQSAIGVNEVDHPLEKIILIYDYFSEHTVVEDTGSHSVLDAYNGEPVTKATKIEAMALIYQYLDLPVYSSQISFTGLSNDSQGEAYFLDVIHGGHSYAIGNYDYFMVGSENINTYVEMAYHNQDLDIEENQFATYIEGLYTQNDLSRSLLKRSAENLNIDWKED